MSLAYHCPRHCLAANTGRQTIMVKFTSLAAGLLLGIAAIGLSTLTPQHANAAIIYGTASLGPSGPSFSTLSGQFLGSRFTLTQATQIDSIGGHYFGNGTLWAALFSLANATTALPTFGGSDPGAFSLAHAILPATPTTGSDVVAALSGGPVVLGPGAYGIVLGGSRLYGMTGLGGMYGTQPNIGSPTYFHRTGGSKNWNNGGFGNTRFVVNGQTVLAPEPGIIAVLGFGLASLGLMRRRQAA